MLLPLDRQRALVAAIRRGECPDYAWVCRQFGVSRDTAKRDKQALLAMGAQIAFDAARGGLRLLNPEWEWPASAVAVAATEAGGVAGAAARALLEAWSPELSTLLSSDDRKLLEAALIFTTSRHVQARADDVCLLVRAIAEQRTVQFVYASPWEQARRQEQPRLVSPWLLQADDGHTYLRGHCHLRAASRSFHLPSIAGLRLADQPAKPRPTNLRPLVRARVGIGGELENPVQAVVHCHGGWAQWVAHERWHPTQHDRWLADGVLERRFPYGMKEEALRRLLPGGADVEVIGPPELREHWVAVVAGMVERTKVHGSASGS